MFSRERLEIWSGMNVHVNPQGDEHHVEWVIKRADRTGTMYADLVMQHICDRVVRGGGGGTGHACISDCACMTCLRVLTAAEYP